ncbi:DUF4239 domain-containing protein [Gloeobacter kilaueensis]|uniref:DUF4239 domain-containing protein n=1 Tax=Gloeobacter kilaueensis (strain ATCC BAA-2537 / CCAP 1431/1 / ULC 316 / JS1) TaxID=1183438 RepID=U5QKQ4_GLOK1|nr:DUF4239 domain-containing protein [Gloeobacter kilaueensis]AGY59562.1 hypothetical protein GKIL_3316 [Gloeobacter kilaueensis JS1]
MKMVDFVNWPTWVSFLLIVVFPTSAFSALAFWTCRRHQQGKYRFISDAAQDVNGYFFSVVGLIVGFILVNCWSDMKRAELDLVNETQKLIVISRLMEQFPVAERQNVYAAINEYIDLVVEQEWPTMEQGRPQKASRPAVEKLYTIFSHIRVATTTQLAAYNILLPTLGELVKLRNERLWLAGGTLPVIMWWLVLLGSVLAMLVMALFPPENPGNYPLLIALFALLFSSIVYVVLLLQYPYSGNLRVDASPFADARQVIEQERKWGRSKPGG